MILLAASLFLTSPAPLDMPRAEAYLVREGEGERRLEDRYNTYDLWMSRAVIGRWFDDDRTFVLSRLDMLPPDSLDEPARTRKEFSEGLVPAKVKERKHLVRMADCLSPVPLSERFEPISQLPLGYKDVRYCQGTNTSVIVCVFLPQRSKMWYMATWELAEDDDFDEMLGKFEHDFLEEKVWKELIPEADEPKAKNQAAKSERELLREDLRHAVAAYPDWYVSESADTEVIDNLESRSFTVSLTNEFPKWRQRYAQVMPTPIDGTNALAVARIYSDRDDYLDAVGDDMKWTAAYWSPQRREIVAFLPQDGKDALMRTIRHEAFHQYLSYASAMISTSPWLNEGYAEFFEDEKKTDWGMVVTPQMLEKYSAYLPTLFELDYKAFYSGSDGERRMKYKLAWSIAVFIEKGIDKIRFQPFKNLKRDYFAALLETQDMREATHAAFGSSDKMLQFITEWRRFWINQ